MRTKHRRTALAAFCAGLLPLILTAGAARAADSLQYPANPARGNGVAVPFAGFLDSHGRPVRTGGAVGVDLVLGSTARPYLPCQNYDADTSTGDSYWRACVVRGSYTTFTRFTAGRGLVFPRGYFVGNTQRDPATGATIRTSWGQRAAGLSFEFYPEAGRADEYVHSRFYVDRFTSRANGWTYSAGVGTIRLVTLADPGTARISGLISAGGRVVAAGRVRLAFFGGSARSSAGYPISSFAVRHSTGRAFWTSGPLYAGTHQLTVVDSATGHRCAYRLTRMRGTTNRWDFDLSKPGFGHRGSCNF